jgi:hypothetical protein
MPHIVIEGDFRLETFFSTYTPLVYPLPNGALKLMDAFLNQSGSNMLIEAIAAEGGPPNRFFIQILQHDHKTTVKLYPGSDPEKTPGVKKLLAIVAHHICTNCPGTTYGPTNLQEYLLEKTVSTENVPLNG